MIKDWKTPGRVLLFSALFSAAVSVEGKVFLTREEALKRIEVRVF